MIGYYVHHQGEGHLSRATAIARALGDVTLTGLSSRPRPADWTGPWLPLARDDQGPHPVDPMAGGALHWAPAGDRGLRERMAQIAAWIATHAPRLIVVDVSVEVAVLARTMGVPVVVMGMPGTGDDPAHQLAYQLADAILAPWPEWADVLTGGRRWRHKTHPVGAISRFDGRPPTDAPAATADPRPRLLVLSGRGGTQLTHNTLAASQRATPAWAWSVLGPPATQWLADPWPLLCAADVVVTHAGQNAVADVAAARRAAVVIPQARPHDEQRATAYALAGAGLAVVRQDWPAPQEWAAVLTAARGQTGAEWTRWSSGSGARRAAQVLRELACARS